MKITLIQIGLALISLFIIGDRIQRYLRREISQSIFKLISFLTVWTVVLIISLFPTTVYYISRKLGFGETLNPLIFAGFIIVFLLIFKIISIIEELERHITKIVRQEALKNIKKRR